MAGDRVGDLGQALDTLLTPFGMVRSDWRRNAELSRDAGSRLSTSASAGSGRKPTDGEAGAGFVSSQRITDALLSLRSVVPRQALTPALVPYLRHGLPLWLLNSNEIPGVNFPHDGARGPSLGPGVGRAAGAACRIGCFLQCRR